MNVTQIGVSVPGTIIQGATVEEYAGGSVGGAGDVNADGFSDLLVAACDADPAGRTDAGRVYLIYGGSSGIGSGGVMDLSEYPGHVVRINGRAANDVLGHYGTGVSGVGDFNGDGYDDFMLGATQQDNDSANGRAYLVLGCEGELGTGVRFNLNTLDGTNGVRMEGIQTKSCCGSTVCGCGCSNEDLLPELIIGAKWTDVSGKNNCGESYMVFGTWPLPGSGGVFQLSSIGESTGVRIAGINDGDHVGQCVSGVGDVNGDGYTDFLITAPKGDPQGRTDAGESYLIYGSGSGIGSGGSFNLSSLDGSNGTRIDCGYSGDSYDGTYIGLFCSEAGDVNGDGYGDLLIGAEYADSQGLTDAGEAYLVYGSASGIGSGGVLDLRYLNHANRVRLEGERALDCSMRSLSGVGDINGDGFADFVLGNPQYDSPSPCPGRAYLVYGAESIGSAGILRVEDINGVNGVLIDGNNDHDGLGQSVSGCGDVNGDGLDDFILGASAADPNGKNAAGEAYLVLGQSSLESASYKSFARSGETPPQWIGDIGDGKMPWGSGRVQIKFADGSGPGNGDSSLQTAALNRTKSGIGNLADPERIAGVFWQIETDRTGWSNATVKLKYTDSEIAGLDEADLHIYRASSLSGPWTLVADQNLQSTRNMISGTVSGFSYFALSDLTPPILGDLAVTDSNPANNTNPASYTNEWDVRATLGAVTGHTADDLYLSENADLSDPVIIPYTGQAYAIFTLSTGDGMKTVYAALSNNAGMGNIVSDTILLDTNAPATAPIPQDPGDYSQSLDVLFTWTSGTDNGSPPSGIASYDFSVGTSPGSDDVFSGNVGNALSCEVSGSDGDTLFARVRAWDNAGNVGPFSANSDGIIIDITPPTVSLSSASPDPTNGSVAVDVHFSEPVMDFQDGDIGTTNSIVQGFGGSGMDYFFQLVALGDGEIKAFIPGGVALDPAGNGNTPSNILSRTFDGTSPTLVLATTAPDPTNSSPIPVNIEWTEPVNDFFLDDIITTNALASNLTGGGTHYSFDLIPTTDSLLMAMVPAGVAWDGAGNKNQDSNIFSLSFDSSPPSVFLDSPAPDPTSLEKIPVSATFSEAVSGFAPDGVIVTNASLHDFSGGDANYSFSLSPTGEGEVTAWINPGAAFDPAGNGNLASNVFCRTCDYTHPGATMSSSLPDPTNTSPIAVTVTFTEQIIGFSIEDIATTNAIAMKLTGEGADYGFELVPTTDSLVMAWLPPGTVEDASGNKNTGSNILSRTFDGTPPAVLLASCSQEPVLLPPIPVTVWFSESITGFTVEDIVTTNSTIQNFAGSGQDYCFDLFPQSEGSVMARVPPDSAKDQAGNGNARSNEFLRTYSPTPTPTPTPIPVYVWDCPETQGWEKVMTVPDGTFINAADGAFYIADHVRSGCSIGAAGRTGGIPGAYGAWQSASDSVPYISGYLYRVIYTIRTTQGDSGRAPNCRLFTDFIGSGGILAATGGNRVGKGIFAPDQNGEIYNIYIGPPNLSGEGVTNLRVKFEVIDFSNDEEGTNYLDFVEIERVPVPAISEGTPVNSFSQLSDFDSWTSQTLDYPGTPFGIAGLGVGTDGLYIETEGEVTSPIEGQIDYGLWTLPADRSLDVFEPGKLYRCVYTLSSPNRDTIGKIRLYNSNLAANWISLFILIPDQVSSHMPDGDGEEYSVWFETMPALYEGEETDKNRMSYNFDISDGSDEQMGRVILERVELYTYDIP